MWKKSQMVPEGVRGKAGSSVKGFRYTKPSIEEIKRAAEEVYG